MSVSVCPLTAAVRERVLILSARSEVEDKVQGLDAGANDYLAKPIHLAELEASRRRLRTMVSHRARDRKSTRLNSSH